MTKKIMWIGLACVIALYVYLMIAWWAPEPITTTPERIDVDQTITIDHDWEWMFEDVAVFEGLDGCICGEPRDDGRMCDVYVEITSDTRAKLWADIPLAGLMDVAGIERIFEGGRILYRDPRYSWQSIVDGICTLVGDGAGTIAPSGVLEYGGVVDTLLDVTFSHITVDCCACCDDDGWLELEISEFCP